MVCTKVAIVSKNTIQSEMNTFDRIIWKRVVDAPDTLPKVVEWKKLPVLKVGRKVLIKTDILEMFMEANEGRDLRDRGNVKAVTRTAAN